MAVGYQSINGFEQNVHECLQTNSGNGINCLVEAVESGLEKEKHKVIPQQAQDKFTHWLDSGRIESIMSIATNDIIEDLLVDKSYRIMSSNNEMAILKLSFYRSDAAFFLRSYDVILQDKEVVNAVCSDSCHRKA